MVNRPQERAVAGGVAVGPGRPAGGTLQAEAVAGRGRRAGGWVLALGLLAALAAGVYAAEKVTVTVLAIEASQSKGPIDPHLKGIAEKLKGVVSFKSLRLLSREVRSGPFGEKQVFRLPERMELVVTPLEKRDGSIRSGFILLRPGRRGPAGAKKETLLNFKASLRPRRGLPIVGPALKEGRLVLVVSVE